MEMLAALEYSAAVEWMRQLHELLPAGAEVAVVGIDRDRVKSYPDAKPGRPMPGWRANEGVIEALFKAAGWRFIVGLPPDEPWAFEVWATR